MAAPVDSFHTDQNRRLRSVDDTAAFLTEQVTGSYMDHVLDFLRLLGSKQALEASGFFSPPDGCFGEALEQIVPNCDMEVIVEDENAEI